MVVYLVQYKYPDRDWSNDTVFTTRACAQSYIDEQTDRAKQLVMSQGKPTYRIDEFIVVEGNRDHGYHIALAAPPSRKDQ